TIIQPPLTTLARRAGFHKLADIADLSLEYQHTGVVSTRARVAAETDVVARFVGAWSEGVYYYRAHRAEARAAGGTSCSSTIPKPSTTLTSGTQRSTRGHRTRRCAACRQSSTSWSTWVTGARARRAPRSSWTPSSWINCRRPAGSSSGSETTRRLAKAALLAA